MFPQQWTPPCGSECTKKFSALTQIPWRVFCKKGCAADGDTWEECVEACNEICYKDPVFKDQQWSAFIDRSPGSENYSKDCFHACVSGCGYKIGIPTDTVEHVQPKRPPKPCIEKKPLPSSPNENIPSAEEMACNSA